MKSIISTGLIASALADQCYPYLDVVILQERTSIAYPTYKGYVDEMPSLQKYFGCQDQYGLATFNDRLTEPFGTNLSYCYFDWVPLGKNFTAVSGVYLHEVDSDAGDFEQNAFGALIQLANSPLMLWRPEALRVVTLVVDYMSHTYNASESLPDFEYDASDDSEWSCNDYKYPSVDQVTQALVENDVKFLQIIVLGSNTSIANDYDSIASWWSDVATTLRAAGIHVAVDGVTEDYKGFGDLVGNNMITARINSYMCTPIPSGPSPTDGECCNAVDLRVHDMPSKVTLTVVGDED